jgi:hypothetical protein
MTTVSLVDRGFLKRDAINATFGLARKEMLRRALAGVQASAPVIQSRVQSHVQGALKGNKAARSIRAKVWNKKRDRFPALQISSKIPWLGVHQHGKTMRGRMLMQIGRTTGRRKIFLALVSRLLASKQAFFRKAKDGQVYLFSSPPKGTRGLGGARRIEREARKAAGGKGTIKRDEAFPIAILATRVTIRKRLKVDSVIESSLPGLVRAIEGAA